jgi:uncharacterized protein YbcI
MARPAPSDGAATATAVSDAVARIYLDKFGKGAVRVETSIREDLIVTVLYDIFTPAEKAMIEHGKGDSVLTTRQLWQHMTEGVFRETVGNVTGRTVVAAVSGFAIPEGMGTEVFVLAPRQA